MKKLKFFLAALVCTLCICPVLAGCSTNNAEYIEDSFTYRVGSYYEYNNEQTINISFNLKIKKVGKYKIEYTLYGDYINDNKYKWVVRKSNELRSEVTDSCYVYDSFEVKTTKGTSRVTIKDIEITEDKDETLYTDIALGLGISAAVLTVGLITLFVLEKKGVIKSKKHDGE